MKTILVVDDQPNVRLMVRLALRDHFAIEEAETADAAYEKILRQPPAGIVLDVMMPGTMNGFDLCQRIKRDSALEAIHVVLVTARGQVADQEFGYGLGANAYFIKPFSPLDLAVHLCTSLLPTNPR